MGSEITVWWGPDDMVSALGFGTEENMAAVRAMKSSLASWHDATPVCLIDRKRLGALAAEQGLAGYTPLERLVLATLGGVAARSGVTPADKRTLIGSRDDHGETTGSPGGARQGRDNPLQSIHVWNGSSWRHWAGWSPARGSRPLTSGC